MPKSQKIIREHGGLDSLTESSGPLNEVSMKVFDILLTATGG